MPKLFVKQFLSFSVTVTISSCPLIVRRTFFWRSGVMTVSYPVRVPWLSPLSRKKKT